MRNFRKYMPFLMLILVLGAGLFATVLPAHAQSRREYDAMAARIEQMEKEIRTLQRSAARGKLPSGTQPTMLPSGQPPLLAKMEVRISQLERELRSLTGLIEEMANRQDIIEREMELFRQDIEFQLREDGDSFARDEDGDPETELASATVIQPILPILPSGDPAAQYDFAFSQLKRGDFDAAQAAFEAFLEAHADDTLAGNAQYWLGETFYVRKDYPRAAEAFLKGFQNYSASNKGPDSLLKLAMSLSAMDKLTEACAALAELDARYPDALPAIKTTTGAQQQRLGC